MLSVLIGCQATYLFADLQAEVLRGKGRGRRGIVFISFWLLLHTIFLNLALACLLVAVFGAVWGGNSTVAKAGTLFTAVMSFFVEISWAFLAPIFFGDDSDEPKDEDESLQR
ncbi:hypothetical protein FRB94_009963 [Tulasnella sp. JGI-2019a]|nr:hypothetical protein FRB94_009963 [Tulasnella sp. JGI-2019a]